MKIKNVVIEGFRAYEKPGDGVFDFTNDDGSCAKFITIYAPNGFGKTSFYDAVEWALTDNIGRFIRDQTRTDNDSLSKSQNLEGKRQPILRNRSILADAPSFVSVVTDEFSERKDVPKASASRRDYVFKKDTSKRGKALAEVFLSQEAIDSFLREERPDARYSRFMENFGDTDETYRSNLVALKREISSILKKITEDELRLKEILTQPINLGVFEEVNKTIAFIRAYAATHDEQNADIIHAVDDKFTLEAEQEIKSFITRRKHEISVLAEKEEAAIIDLQDILSRESEIVAAIQDRKDALGLLADAYSKIGKLDIRDAEINRVLQISAVIAVDVSLAEDLNKIFLHLGEFRRIEIAVRGHEAALRRKVEEETELSAQINSHLENEIEIKNEIQVADRISDELIALQRVAPAVYEEIHDLKIDFSRRFNAEEEGRSRINAINTKIENIRENISKIKEIEINEKFLESGHLGIFISLGYSFSRLRNAIRERDFKASALEISLSDVDAVREQVGKISQLAAIGAEIVSERHVSECPLCSHTHSSFESLLHQILNNNLLLPIEANAIRSTQIARDALDQAGKVVGNQLDDWRAFKNASLEKLDLELSSQQDDLDLVSKEVNDLSKSLEEITKNIDLLQGKVFHLSAELLTEKISGEILNIFDERTKALENLRVVAEKRAACLETLKTTEQNIRNLRLQIEILFGNESYREVKSFCLTRGIPSGGEEEAIGGIVRAVELRLLELRGEEAEAGMRLGDIDLEDSSIKLLVRSDLAMEIDELRSKVLQSDLILVPAMATLQKYRMSLNVEVPIVEIFNAVRLDIASYREKSSRHLEIGSYLLLLNEQIDAVMPYLGFISAKSESDALSLKKDKHEALSSSIDLEYAAIIDKLQSRIDDFFYTSLINSIYKKIDPHPDFKEVRFSCEFPDGERPRLHVLVSDQLGETISPNLYFSAAQINILSLSIFLARALHVKVDGVPVQCIFIDDPIHSMDSINVLASIDLLRTISKKFDRQIILSTHDKSFFELLKRKIPRSEYLSKFVELESFGKVSRFAATDGPSSLASDERYDDGSGVS